MLGPRRTAGSDLDIVVLLADGRRTGRACTRGWPVELFVQTPERMAEFLASELARRRWPGRCWRRPAGRSSTAIELETAEVRRPATAP